MSDLLSWREAPVARLGFNGHVTKTIEMSGCNNIGEVADALGGGDTFKLEADVLSNVRREILDVSENGLRPDGEEAIAGNPPVLATTPAVPAAEKPKRKHVRKPAAADAAPVETNVALAVRAARNLTAKIPEGVLIPIIPHVGEIADAIDLAGGAESFKQLIEALK